MPAQRRPGFEPPPRTYPEHLRAALADPHRLCRGHESAEVHAQRLLDALELLRVARWPYQGATGLTERHEALCQIHVIRDWFFEAVAT